MIVHANRDVVIGYSEFKAAKQFGHVHYESKSKERERKNRPLAVNEGLVIAIKGSINQRLYDKHTKSLIDKLKTTPQMW